MNTREDPAHWYPNRQHAQVAARDPLEATLPYHYTPPNHGNPDQQAEYDRVFAAAQAAQKTRLAVAPECGVDIKGEIRTGGQEVTLAELPNYRHRRALVMKRVLIEVSEDELAGRNCPIDAPYRVGKNSLTSRRGILPPGVQCCAADFAQEAVPPLRIGSGKFDEDSKEIKVTVPARPPTDGTHELAALVERKLVIAHDPGTTPKRGKTAA